MALNSGLWLPMEKPDFPELDPLDPLNRGLILFYPLGEGRGLVARDLCKPGNHATLANFSAYPWTLARSGGCCPLFDGATTVITSGANLPLPTSHSVCAWVYSTGAQANNGRIALTDVNNFFALGVNSTHTTYSWIVHNSTLDGCSGGPIVNNTWQFVCGTFDTVTLRLYVNGVEVANQATAGNPSGTGTLKVGKGAATGWWKGKIEGVRYYGGRVLSPSDIWRLYTDQWAGLLQDDTPDYRVASAGGNVPLTVTLGQAAWVGTGVAPLTDFRLGVTLGQASWAWTGVAPFINSRLGLTLGQARWFWNAYPLSGMGGAVAALLGLFPTKGSRENLRSGSRRGGTDVT